MTEFWLCFVPIFVAMDAIGALPVFLGLTEGLERHRVRRVILQSMLTATGVAVVFLFVGQAIFRLLGITTADFMIAGGVLLFLFALSSLLDFGHERPKADPESVGAVPLGVPLIVGPAVLTTALALIESQGIITTAAATLVNILIAGVVFCCAGPITRVLGKTGARTVSKLVALLLGAIAVMMIRRGLTFIITGETPLI
jgi:multiple antibiotic resistance protein